MDCLYISHTGLTEPLGRSQVLAYLEGLARRGHEIEILSHEPAGTSSEAMTEVAELTTRAGIRWSPQVRSPSHHLGVKLWESGRAALLGLAAALRRRPRIVHARSYLPAAVADVIASVSPDAKLLFDCRGMLGDEYVDAGYWTESRIEYRLLKRFERRLFNRSEGMVVLTEALRDWLRETGAIAANVDVEVVPCCVDETRFRSDAAARAAARAEIGVPRSAPVVLYSGTLGSWYQEEEMARFAGHVARLRPDARFLVLTRADAARLRGFAARVGVEPLIRAVRPADMPRLLPAGDIGLSFIRPCFSKKGSSPTKLAEYLAAGVPVVANDGIGDQGALREEVDACVVVDGYDDERLARAASAALALAERPHEERAAATTSVVRRRFSLEHLGVRRYDELYRRLVAS